MNRPHSEVILTHVADRRSILETSLKCPKYLEGKTSWCYRTCIG